MKKILLPVLLVTSYSFFAQVGINTDFPKATLDIVGSPTDPNKFDGVIAPRITASNLKSKSYGSPQTGAIVYVTSPDVSPSGQTIDVTSTGYYFFNGDPSVNRWVKIVSGNLALNAVTTPYDTPNSGSLLLNDKHYTVRIFGGNTGIILPDASTCKGRIYILIGSNGISSKSISTVAGGGIYDDVTNANISSISGSQRYQIQSDGISWIVIGR